MGKANGFSVFASELRKGKSMSMQQACTEAAKYWGNLSQAEKEAYNNKASKLNQQKKVKQTTLGESLDEIEREQRELEERDKQAKIDTENIIKLAKINGSLEDYFFYTIHINNFCYHDISKTYYPAEVGLVKFNLRNGVTDIFHKNIYPGNFPIGYKYTVDQISEDTHKMETDFGSRNNMEEVLIALIKELKPVAGSGTPPVFVAESLVHQTDCMLKQMCFEYDHPNIFKVYSLEYLMFVLKNTLLPECWPWVNIAKNIIEKDQFEAVHDIACDYHEALDAQKYCSKAIAIRYAYMVCDQCNECTDIPLIPGKHIPKGMKLNQLERVEASNTGTTDNGSIASLIRTLKSGTASTTTTATTASRGGRITGAIPRQSFTNTSTGYDDSDNASNSSYHGFKSSDSSTLEDEDSNWEVQKKTSRLRKPLPAAGFGDMSGPSSSQSQSQDFKSQPALSQLSTGSGFAPSRRPGTSSRASQIAPQGRGRGLFTPPNN